MISHASVPVALILLRNGPKAVTLAIWICQREAIGCSLREKACTCRDDSECRVQGSLQCQAFRGLWVCPLWMGGFFTGPKMSFSRAGAPPGTAGCSQMVLFTPEVFNPCASNISADRNQEVGDLFLFSLTSSQKCSISFNYECRHQTRAVSAAPVLLSPIESTDLFHIMQQVLLS